jgi:hypothetical protein
MKVTPQLENGYLACIRNMTSTKSEALGQIALHCDQLLYLVFEVTENKPKELVPVSAAAVLQQKLLLLLLLLLLSVAHQLAAASEAKMDLQGSNSSVLRLDSNFRQHVSPQSRWRGLYQGGREETDA